MEQLHAAKVQNDPHSAEPLVALYRGTSWVSRAIRWQTWSDYSHAALWLPDGSVIEAWHKGGVQRHATLGAVHTPGTVVDLFRVVAPVEWDAVLASAEAHLDKGYAFSNILRFMLRWTSTDCRHPQRLICSQLVHLLIEEGGVRLLHRICASKVSPRDLSISPLLRFVRSETTAAPEKKTGMRQRSLDSWSGFAVPEAVFALVVAGLMVLGFALFTPTPSLPAGRASAVAQPTVITREPVPHFRLTLPDLR